MRRRKNYFLDLMFMIIFWLMFALMIFFVEPEMIKDIPFKDTYLPFFLNLFLALFFTFALIFRNNRRGFMAALSLILLLSLKLNGLANLFNFLLIVSVSLLLDRLFSS